MAADDVQQLILLFSSNCVVTQLASVTSDESDSMELNESYGLKRSTRAGWNADRAYRHVKADDSGRIFVSDVGD